MSPTHDLPRHRIGLLLLGLPPRVAVQIFQDLAVLPHVRVDPCRADFLVAIQHLPPDDLLPSRSVASPAKSSLTTTPAPSDESRRVLVLHQGLGPHALPRGSTAGIASPCSFSRTRACRQDTSSMDFRMRLGLRIIDRYRSRQNSELWTVRPNGYTFGQPEPVLSLAPAANGILLSVGQRAHPPPLALLMWVHASRRRYSTTDRPSLDQILATGSTGPSGRHDPIPEKVSARLLSAAESNRANVPTPSYSIGSAPAT